jgi:hypothetical protein
VTAPLSEFLEVVRHSLGAVDARVLDEGEIPRASDGVLVCELPQGQLLAVSFAAPPPDPNSARRRLEMLVRAFSNTLSATAEAPPEVPKGRALHEELAALVKRAGALDAFVIDAHSPAIWGAASEHLIEMSLDEPDEEPHNVYRLDGQPAWSKRSELARRARELGVRSFEALALDPRTLALVPRSLCERYRVVPLFVSSKGLLLAMADPTDVAAIYEVVLATGLDVEPALGNERLIRFVIAWNTEPSTRISAPPAASADGLEGREQRAAAARAKWTWHFATHKALQLVRSMPELAELHRGRHLNRTVSEADFSCIVRSFASIYVLVVVFHGSVDELRAKSAISQALPLVESLVVALPPREPPPSIDGAKALRGTIRR